MKDKVVRLSKAMSNETVKRIPYIILIAIFIGVFAGVKSYNKTSDAAQSAAQAATAAKENSEATAKNTEAIKKNQAESNRKRDEQTLLLCRIILSAGKLDLTDSQSQQIESICKESIERITQENARAAATPAQGASPQSRSNPAGNSGGSSSQPTTGQPPAQSNNSQPPVVTPPPLIVVPPLPQPCLDIGLLKVC